MLGVLAAGCAMALGAVAVKLLPVSGAAGSALTLALGGTLVLGVYVGALYVFRAMPPEVHTNLFGPALVPA